MSIVIDNIVNIGLEIARDRILDAAAERKVRKQLGQFLQRQMQANEFCTREEEFDFQSLAEYIRNDMIEDVKRRLFGRTSKEREEAREMIRHKAMAYAQSNTAMSRERAANLADKAMDILQRFAWGRLDKELALAVTEIEDTLESEMTEQHQTQLEQMKSIEDKIGQENLLSMDHIIMAMHEGRYEEVANKVTSIQNAISSTHRLFPYYGYALKDGRYVSIPLTEEAEKKYPVHFNIKASAAWFDDGKKENIDTSLLMRAFRHQRSLKLDVVSVTKYLGHELDPIQAEAEAMNGKTVTVVPPAFPEAFPCGIYVDDFVLFDDIPMRIKEIFDNDSMLLTNEEDIYRNFDVQYTTSSREDRFKLNITPKNATHAEFLHYLEAMEQIRNGGEIRVKNLSTGTVLDTGTSTKIDKEDDPRVIETLRKIVAIEQYFDITLDCIRTIQWEDYNTINRLYDVIVGRGCITSTPSMDFSIQIEENERSNLMALISTKHKLVYSTHVNVTLFDQTLLLPLHREAPCVAVAEPEKILEKMKVLEAGDTLRLTFVSGNGEKVIKVRDTLASENDNFSGLSYQMPESY